MDVLSRNNKSRVMNGDKVREEKIIKINVICSVFAIVLFVIIVLPPSIVNFIPYMIHLELRLEYWIDELPFIVFFDVFFSIFCAMLLFKILRSKYAYELYPERRSFKYKLKFTIFFIIASIMIIVVYFILCNNIWGIGYFLSKYSGNYSVDVLCSLVGVGISVYVGNYLFWRLKKRFLHEQE